MEQTIKIKNAISNTIEASGEITITENGIHDVRDYATANVNVPIDGSDLEYVPQLINRTITELPVNTLEGVTAIGEYAFYKCRDLKTIELPDTVLSIENNAFRYCNSLNSIEFGNGITYIGSDAFSYCTSLTSITLPDSVTKIANGAFRDCSSLRTVILGNNVKDIWHSFDTEYLDFNEYENKGYLGTTTNPYYALVDSYPITGDPERIVIHPDCKVLAGGIFNSRDFKTIELPDGLQSIGFQTFYECYSLKSITIPSSVTYIASFAFLKCASLSDITYNGTVEQWNSIELEDSWYVEVPATYVQCTDGQVQL